MKHSRISPFFYLFIAIFGGLLLGRSAASDLVDAETSGSAPTENVLFFFEGEQEPNGWGWLRTGPIRKDTGFSFRSTLDDRISKITFHIRRVLSDFPSPGSFNLEILETDTPNENPQDGKKVYSGNGELFLTKQDGESYLTFTLKQPVPIISGATYTVLLTWENDAPHQLVELCVNSPYTQGLIWHRAGQPDEKLKPVNTSSKPGLVFYIQ